MHQLKCAEMLRDCRVGKTSFTRIYNVLMPVESWKQFLWHFISEPRLTQQSSRHTKLGREFDDRPEHTEEADQELLWSAPHPMVRHSGMTLFGETFMSFQEMVRLFCLTRRGAKSMTFGDTVKALRQALIHWKKSLVKFTRPILVKSRLVTPTKIVVNFIRC